jgi:hypothetical protein
MTRKTIAESIVADWMLKTRRRCCLCVYLENVTDRRRLQIAHIDQDASNDSPANLVPLCLDHHDEYDSTARQSKNITPHEVRAYRDRLIKDIADGTLLASEPRPTERLVSEISDKVASQRSYAFCVLFAKLERLLHKHDPIGIARVSPDEYDPEAHDIARRLLQADGQVDIEALCRDVFTRWFYKEAAEGFRGYPALAQDIEKAWTHYAIFSARYEDDDDR